MQQRPASPSGSDGADSRRRIEQLEQEAADLRTQLAALVALVRAAWAGSQEATDQLADAVNWTREAAEDAEPPASALLLSDAQKEALRHRVAQLEDLLSQEELRAAWDNQGRRVSFRPASGNSRHSGGGGGSIGVGGSAAGIRVRDLVLPASGSPAPRMAQRAHRGQPPPPPPPPGPPDDLFDPQSLMARANARVQSAACPPPPRPNSSISGRQQRPRTGGPAERRRQQPSIPQSPIPAAGPAGVSVIGERPLKFERGLSGASARNDQHQQQQRLTSVRLVPANRRRGQQQPNQHQADRLAVEVSAAEQRSGQLESEFDRVMLDLQRKLGLDSHGLV